VSPPHHPKQVRYPAIEPALPAGLKGEHFAAILGARQSLLEALLVKRRVMGPGWVLLQAPRRKEGSAMVGTASWRGWVRGFGLRGCLSTFGAGQTQMRERIMGWPVLIMLTCSTTRPNHPTAP
jgi:hypothetical protein